MTTEQSREEFERIWRAAQEARDAIYEKIDCLNLGCVKGRVYKAGHDWTICSVCNGTGKLYRKREEA